MHDTALLGALYDNNGTPRNQADLKALQSASAAAYADQATVREERRFGAAPWQSLAVFRPAARPVGALVFVHGGRWQLNTSRDTAFWAEACCDAGLVFIGLNFPKRKEAALLAQVDAVAAGIEAALAITATLDIPPSRVCLAGHSSGAHLALAALLPNGGRAAPAAAAQLGALLLLGGIYDLQPLRRTAHQEALQFTQQEALEGSPLLTLARLAQQGEGCVLPPSLVAAGAEESSEFRRQARALHCSLQHHTRASWYEVPQRAHFDAALEFNAPQSVLRNFALHHGL